MASQVCRIVTFAVIYPYIHLSGENSITKEDILPYAGPECKEWVDQAFYIEIDHVPSKNSFSIKELDYVIFIGVQAHADALSSKIGRDNFRYLFSKSVKYPSAFYMYVSF